MGNQSTVNETTESKINLSIPWRSIWSSLGLIALILFGWLQTVGYLIPGFKEIFSLQPETTTINHIGLMWFPVISYLLISTGICLLFNIFKPLKKFEEVGLFFYLIVGLIGGLIGGLIWGLIWNLIWNLIMGLIWGLIIGLIWGLFSEKTN